jgi:hypothetical protein
LCGRDRGQGLGFTVKIGHGGFRVWKTARPATSTTGFAERDEENDQQDAVDQHVELPERPHELASALSSKKRR